MKTSTPTEPVEYLTILDELSNVTRTPVSDNSNYYTMITKKVVTPQEERYQSLDCTKLTSDSNYTTLITTQEERYQSLDCTKLTSDNNYTTLMKYIFHKHIKMIIYFKKIMFRFVYNTYISYSMQLSIISFLVSVLMLIHIRIHA